MRTFPLTANARSSQYDTIAVTAVDQCLELFELWVLDQHLTMRYNTRKSHGSTIVLLHSTPSY
jgi:hypothetical protein